MNAPEEMPETDTFLGSTGNEPSLSPAAAIVLARASTKPSPPSARLVVKLGGIFWLLC